MIKILENAKYSLIFGSAMHMDEDYIDGAKESIRFCIRKHEENWALEEFESDLNETKKRYVPHYSSYERGILDGLEFNINEMKKELVNNE